MPRFSMMNGGARKPTNTGYISKKVGLPTTFDCLFCNGKQSVHVTLNKKAKVGSLVCRGCRVSWECEVGYLDSEVDVNANWVDACDETARSAARSSGVVGANVAPSNKRRASDIVLEERVKRPKVVVERVVEPVVVVAAPVLASLAAPVEALKAQQQQDQHQQQPPSKVAVRVIKPLMKERYRHHH